MSVAAAYHYTYTPEQVTAAFDTLSPTLFSAVTAETTPRMLVTAGVQSSGKTYLLEKSLLPSGRYQNHVRLYLPQYRERHPQYEEMIKIGVLHAYEHTETFVRDLCQKIFARAFREKLNIILECAFDTIEFAALPEYAASAGYQLEVHVVACNYPFAFISGVQRVFKSLEKGELERFVKPSALKSSLGNACGAVHTGGGGQKNQRLADFPVRARAGCLAGSDPARAQHIHPGHPAQAFHYLDIHALQLRGL
ncbi:zeta toxin family protein [Pseudomonas paraglycinae]|uniref:zeta toxin family protein n=1 Tax=Pseudomonas paraglycinae TaxID=2892330 RepID=UPI00283AA04F|nr:zeta toxin family protein [Pseudomonas paraglycinae]